jgi:uncharacterized protein YdhG (YjbR/CyaY superfamily)
MAAKPQTIGAYLAGLPADQRVALKKVRKVIKAAVPKAEERFSYGMPAFRLGKMIVAGFSASAKHYAFYPMSGRTIEAPQADLVGYDTSKGTVRFSAERVLPAGLIRKLVKTRSAEVLEASSKSRTGQVTRRRTTVRRRKGA